MILVISNLVMNGGSTFVYRMAKKMNSEGSRCGVLILAKKYDDALLMKLKEIADVYFLENFQPKLVSRMLYGQLLIAGPYSKSSILDVIERHCFNMHCTGIYSLLFSVLVNKLCDYKLKISFGVYHQNEFLFESPDYYFVKMCNEIIKKSNANQFVFFNDKNKMDYQKHFEMDLERSAVTPIGIDVPLKLKALGAYNSRKILSIGSLVGFKSYNENMIRLMPEIINLDNSFTYHIYGEGPEQDRLKTLASSLGIGDSVFFHGGISYSKIDEVLEEAFLFVGSGTAILEASIRKVPSIVGVESYKEPFSYGFLCDVPGYSYNEFDDSQKFKSIFKLIEGIVNDEESWGEVASACHLKAMEFTIDKTAQVFDCVHSNDGLFADYSSIKLSKIKLLFSMLKMGIYTYLSLDKSVINRRLQGSIASD